MDPRFAHIRDWIFDLDNCLYPASTGLFELIDQRMGAFAAVAQGSRPTDPWTITVRPPDAETDVRRSILATSARHDLHLIRFVAQHILVASRTPTVSPANFWMSAMKAWFIQVQRMAPLASRSMRAGPPRRPRS